MECALDGRDMLPGFTYPLVPFTYPLVPLFA
jgi:hypothetical protein